MRANFGVLALTLCSLAKSVFASVDANAQQFENLNVLRTISVADPYVHQSVDLQIENVGTEDASSYFFVLPDSAAARLAKFAAKDIHGNPLVVRKVDQHLLAGFQSYEIELLRPLQPLEKVQFGTLLAFSRGTEPYPAEAKQSDQQWMLYNGTENYVSVYNTRNQESQTSLPTEKYELLGSEDKTAAAGIDATGFFTFGLLKDVPALEVRPLALRFENPLPQPFVENLNRTVWVSHWGGSVSFDESYDVHNVGAKVKSPFSRLDFSKPKVGFSLNTAAIRALRIVLPKDSREEYYVDLVGNVSTSVVNDGSLDVIPRYPIMGGWFYNFTIGWASDLSTFVRQASSSNYILKVPVVGGPEKIGYASAHTKIVLPEGSQAVEFYSEVPYDNARLSTTYSYLDIQGRPTVELDFQNIVSEQSDAFIYVTYRYTLLSSLRKPISYTAVTAVTLLAAKYAIGLF